MRLLKSKKWTILAAVLIIACMAVFLSSCGIMDPKERKALRVLENYIQKDAYEMRYTDTDTDVEYVLRKQVENGKNVITFEQNQGNNRDSVYAVILENKVELFFYEGGAFVETQEWTKTQLMESLFVLDGVKEIFYYYGLIGVGVSANYHEDKAFSLFPYFDSSSLLSEDLAKATVFIYKWVADLVGLEIEEARTYFGYAEADAKNMKALWNKLLSDLYVAKNGQDYFVESKIDFIPEAYVELKETLEEFRRGLTGDENVQYEDDIIQFNFDKKAKLQSVTLTNGDTFVMNAENLPAVPQQVKDVA